jgi:hypothetical protein
MQTTRRLTSLRYIFRSEIWYRANIFDPSNVSCWYCSEIVVLSNLPCWILDTIVFDVLQETVRISYAYEHSKLENEVHHIEIEARSEVPAEHSFKALSLPYISPQFNFGV